MEIVTISTLYPNKNDPKHGVFVHTRLKQLLRAYPEISATVIAPVPWFPFSWKKFGEYAKYAGVPYSETIDGITIFHPKYVVLPKVGMYITPFFLSKAIKKTLQKLLKRKNVDLIDGHYFFPDGVAIESVASRFNIPFTCTARGTDINLVPTYPKARKMLHSVFANSSHMMSVCQALKDEMMTLGVEDSRVTVVRNGVDLSLFSASDDDTQKTLKSSLGLDTPHLIISVGWLIERKGHHLIIESLKKLNDVTLAIAGDGPDLKKLQLLAKESGVSERVKFLGALSQSSLNEWFRSADLSVLASSREGWANVLLESMASGTPVVATKVWGTPEVVKTKSAGILVDRSSDAIAKGVRQLLEEKPSRVQTRKYAEQFSWSESCDSLYRIFLSIVENKESPS
ncbi:glycosyltransferase family 4 protein [Alteromonas macleodii]|jgi:teichuronic acid biosynthesis glycosyltransferase TuaC|uniref:glycosyltransferase family 4 protein n=1 Tax=Alteromonas TaxID=226 RepID=UPI000D768C7A|nr:MULTISPECIES: glycosyltransferase family 4 protein [Alteromonas]MCZ4240952.1 glycosyltransferase family 4 protein [Alteromonas macleodii]PXW71548.1 glycosyltransferase involved in cell wall biosynthesis [Alteromonas sp. I10]|tara:strand:+ start:16582 stop:17775 length:1194 start_codon:yes stop_codon:yes gene_type:complete